MAETSKSVDSAIEREYVQLKKELLDTKAALSQSDKEKERLRNENYRLKKKTGIESEPKVAVEAPVQAPVQPNVLNTGLTEAKEDKTEHKHVINSWSPRFCPDGDCKDGEAERKDWKSEAKCRDCGLDYGKVDTAKAVARCPNCGGKHYVRV